MTPFEIEARNTRPVLTAIIRAPRGRLKTSRLQHLGIPRIDHVPTERILSMAVGQILRMRADCKSARRTNAALGTHRGTRISGAAVLHRYLPLARRLRQARGQPRAGPVDR
jgi:hypothetical protein